ncbi:MAG: DUF4355 domain-containing protein [Clostridia bacterium]|jgi:hypothetical protein|nr:DUF4355 domain-containing protein [Clostridia bacterium]MCI2014560.1 DUF4355 domain-containing protein [Clostridia bacterium]
MEENLNTGVEDNETENKETQEQETKTFTQADFDREISKMYDKFEKKFSKRAEEAQKLASMNAEEKAKYEFEQRVKELEKKEKEWTLKENKYEAGKILGEKGLPVAFADFIVAQDAETMMANIKLFDTEFKKAVSKEVQARIGGNIPKGGTADTPAMTKEKFKTLSLTEQQELYKSDKDLYMELAQ